MNTKLINKKITKENYEELIDSIMNIFKMSNKEMYFFLSLKIENEKCSLNLSILNKEGTKQEYEKIEIENIKEYQEAFLKKLVERLNKECKIEKRDIVNLDGDDWVAFRMITNYNDLITIDGLEPEQAKKLFPEEEKVNININNSKGASNLGGFLFMLTFLVISFILVVTFTN